MDRAARGPTDVFGVARTNDPFELINRDPIIWATVSSLFHEGEPPVEENGRLKWSVIKVLVPPGLLAAALVEAMYSVTDRMHALSYIFISLPI